jgi:hypothetical protein
MACRPSSLSFGLLVALSVTPLSAWSQSDDGTVAPAYRSLENAKRLQGNGSFVSPEDHGRPGEVFFLRAAAAVRHEDYKFAADMYKVAASWAFKPAQYNLAVMYFKGEGVAVDKPLAMAWAALAAERGEQDYVDARELIYSTLGTAEFAKANEIWRDLKKTYGDDVALRRAKARWAEVRNNVTGSHVGSVGHLLVGNGYDTGHLGNVTAGLTPKAAPFSDSPFGPAGAGAVDGSIAYRQLHESDNPYDPKFERHPGTATVEPLVPLPDEHAAPDPSGTGSDTKHNI